MMELTPDTLSQRSANDYEENIWLLQQQYPERTLKHLSAWQLDTDIDLSRLESALQAVIESLPDLNTRYAFNDDGEVDKLQANDWQSCVERIHLPGDASDHLQAEQAAPWDAQSQPPFKALIVQTTQAPILALMLHKILDHTCQAHDLYRQALTTYTGHPIRDVPRPWLHRPADNGETAGAPIAQANDPAITATILNEFRQALAEPGMAATDDFFDFGGHSLLATRIIGKLLSSHGIEVQFNDFFSAPSAAALAARARLIAKADAPATGDALPHDVQTAPFALAQASLGRAYAAFEFGTIFNLPFAMEFLDKVDEALFEQAFHDLLERHASLRSTFHFDGNEAYQQIVPASQLSRYKWFWPSHESRGATLQSEAAYQFDLTRELPLRVRFIEDAQRQRQTLSLLVHHMAIDEWSLNVMMEELAQAYLARAADRVPLWKSPAPSFHEFALRQQATGINQQHLDYWTNMLRDATRGLTLPASGQPAEQASTKAQWFEIKPAQDTIDHLYAFARQNNASLFGVVYSAIVLSLHKLAGLKDLVIGTSASGRTDPAYYDTVGYFTTMVAHRVQFDPQQAVGAMIESVSRLINDSMAYADVPMEQIQQALGMTPADGLLFDVYIQIHANNALNGALHTPDTGAIRYRQIDPDKNQSMFGIQFEIMENMIDGNRALRLVITYRSDRYSAEQMARMSAMIEQMFALFSTPGADAIALDHIRI
ncbi:condensation domain-containing protein [Pseudomonas sp. MWU15-20650]|uniref:condensation domain-containing protein n=1 Tax=Pseudomonas sp. MWU15-20650 TaxID=2933107 RepID=UPI00200D278B|nr:condensation domain-containing protein [Pseudomonas sp. MWU15-20650]